MVRDKPVKGFSYIHNFIIILSRVYHEPIQRPAPSWLVSLIGRALHRYRRGQGFESRKSLNFFQLLDCKTVGFFSQNSKRNCKVGRNSSRPLFLASFLTFCLTARAYLNTQNYGPFCSLAFLSQLHKLRIQLR